MSRDWPLASTTCAARLAAGGIMSRRSSVLEGKADQAGIAGLLRRLYGQGMTI